MQSCEGGKNYMSVKNFLHNLLGQAGEKVSVYQKGNFEPLAQIFITCAKDIYEFLPEDLLSQQVDSASYDYNPFSNESDCMVFI